MSQLNNRGKRLSDELLSAINGLPCETYPSGDFSLMVRTTELGYYRLLSHFNFGFRSEGADSEGKELFSLMDNISYGVGKDGHFLSYFFEITTPVSIVAGNN